MSGPSDRRLVNESVRTADLFISGAVKLQLSKNRKNKDHTGVNEMYEPKTTFSSLIRKTSLTHPSKSLQMCLGEGDAAWKIIPVRKCLVAPVSKPFRPFGRGPTTLLRGLMITMVSNHVSKSWEAHPPSAVQCQLRILRQDTVRSLRDENVRLSEQCTKLEAFKNGSYISTAWFLSKGGGGKGLLLLGGKGVFKGTFGWMMCCVSYDLNLGGFVFFG